MTSHSFIIPGKPQPKQRPRFVVRGKHVKAYTPKQTKEYQGLAAKCAKESKAPYIRSGPVWISVCIWLEWPKSLHRKRKPKAEQWHDRKPDFTNVLRSVEDGLSGVCWGDDAQIAKAYIQKRYLPQGEAAYVQVEYGPLSATP